MATLRLCRVVLLMGAAVSAVMAADSRVIATVVVLAAVTLPLLYLPRHERLRILGLEGRVVGLAPTQHVEGTSSGLSPSFIFSAALLTIAGTFGGLLVAVGIMSFTSQPAFLVQAYVALATTVAGPIVLALCLWKRARWYMAAYCFLVVGQLAVLYVAVYINDHFGPVGS